MQLEGYEAINAYPRKRKRESEREIERKRNKERDNIIIDVSLVPCCVEQDFKGSTFNNNILFFSHLCGVAGECIIHAPNKDIFIHSLQSTRLRAKGDLVLGGVASCL